MSIVTILALVGLALAIGLAGRVKRLQHARRFVIFAASLMCVYWLQPSLPIRGLSYWLPTALIGLVFLCWLVTSSAEERFSRENWFAMGFGIGLALLLALVRLIDIDWLLPYIPPTFQQAAGLVIFFSAAGAGLAIWLRGRNAPSWLLGLMITVILVILILLKTPDLTLQAAQLARRLAGQDPALAKPVDIRWIGFSYIAFRLIHTLRDRQDGRLPGVSLVDYAAYVFFFPALLAGPIDRLERFEKDFRTIPLAWQGSEGATRIFYGLVKKFAVADTLALIALNPQSAAQVNSTGWMWVMVYMYALQIFFDFSGYTDIAIGMAMLLGIRLPENFAAPYLKPNLTLFWNSWHMSLTQWFRGYFFNPFVRVLRRKPLTLGPVWVMFVAQTITMLLIGLWHGITLNFAIWGLWHGLGLFVQNRWSEAARPYFASRNLSPWLRKAIQVMSTILTFHYVAAGWVFFALTTIELAGRVLAVLFGGV